ncbi:GAP family protein [Nocardia jiangsuensis]|uniref:GAP family protein n=1 Tax=Nocardia jiangsuensis TaxID=1691563 RepID=A0ABV8DQD6_9NOCA
MLTLLLALAGFAFLDALDVLLVGITTAVVLDSRLARRSPLPGGLAFIGGVFLVTTTFGIAAVLGLHWFTELIDVEITPAIRYRAEFLAGLVLIGLAAIRAPAAATPPEWTTRVRRQPWLLALAGIVIGLVQAPTAIPYLTALALLSAHRPLPAAWPLIIVAYCLAALLPPLLVLALSLRRTAGARRVYRRMARALARHGAVALRILFALLGFALVVHAVLNHQHLLRPLP